MKPLPPARYRIEERGRRLVVIDQWAGNVEVTGAMPARADVVAPGQSASVTPGSLSASAAVHRAAAASSVRSTAASASTAPRRAGPAGPAGPTSGANALANVFFRLQPDGRGGAMLSTLRLYDPRGPRQLALNQTDLAKLNGLAILLLIMLIIVVVVALSTSWMMLFIFAFVLLRVNGSMRERVGKWLDARA
jgi:hypothetical protein